MKKIATCLCVFLSGWMAGINSFCLWGSPEYQAHVGKVAFAIAFGLFFMTMTLADQQEGEARDE